VHRCRNLLAKVPTHAQDEVKQAFWQIFDDITAEAGEAAVAEACRRATASAKRYRDRYPAAVACLPELTTFLRFPRGHWGRIGHTNLIERTFGHDPDAWRNRNTRDRRRVVGPKCSDTGPAQPDRPRSGATRDRSVPAVARYE
jgi:transposase-like protein